MTGFNQPILADEPGPRTWRQFVFTVLALVVIVIVGFRLGRADPFDESSVKLITPYSPENDARVAKALDAGDMETVYAILRPAADAGNSHAAYLLGALYVEGFNGRYLVDHCKAMPWFVKAARLQHPFAPARLADSYLRGAGVARDETLAYFWYRTWVSAIEDARTMDAKLAGSFEKYMGRQAPYSWRDSEVRRRLEEAIKDWTPHTPPDAVIQQLPDIPVVDWFARLFWIDGQGCHGASFWSPSDW